MSSIVPISPIGLASVIKGELGLSIDKPFSNEIYLTSFHIAGTRYAENIMELSRKLDKETKLFMYREPGNPYDEMAVVIKDEDGNKLGYMPRRINHMPARLMDAGKLLYVLVRECNLYQDNVDIWVEIYMKD